MRLFERMSMTDIERMAREAGMHNDGQWWFDGDSNAQCDVSTVALTRFAALVRAQALEDAARVCEAIVAANEYAYADECAAAIRALAGQPGA